MSNWFISLIKSLFSFSPPPENERVPGLIRSLPDFRDINVRDILGSIDLAPLPERYRIPYLLPIKDQGTTPTCVGQACASIKDEKERREKIDIDFSGEWIYLEAKKIDGIPNIKGTYFRTGLQILQKVGAKPLATSKVQGQISDFKIGGYARVDCDIESLKRAIIQVGCVLAGFYVYPNSFDNAYIKKGNTIIGAHATILIGFCRISKNDDVLVKQGKMTINEAIDRWQKGISRYSSV